MVNHPHFIIQEKDSDDDVSEQKSQVKSTPRRLSTRFDEIARAHEEEQRQKAEDESRRRLEEEKERNFRQQKLVSFPKFLVTEKLATISKRTTLHKSAKGISTSGYLCMSLGHIS